MLEGAIKGAIPSKIACDNHNLLSQHICVPIGLDTKLKAAKKLTKYVFNRSILWLVWRSGYDTKIAGSFACLNGMMHQWGPMGT